MKVIILSGGSGLRLWPLSNETRSKQFFRIFRQKNNDVPTSMIQRVHKKIVSAGLTEDTIFVTGKNQVDPIYNQLGENVRIVTEPSRRNTFPAIALASAYLYQSNDPDEEVVVIPVDQYAEDDYFNLLKEMAKLTTLSSSNLVLMGIKPTYPSEKYGYILHDKKGNVTSFKEKPNRETARTLIRDGALWNGGVFAFKLKYMINIIKKYYNFESFQDLYNNYDKLPRNSIDYEIVERENNIKCVEYKNDWRDLGTWNTLSEVMDTNFVGNVLLDSNCDNTHAINELDIPLIVTGVNNCVVACSHDGILVSDKDSSSYIKPLVEKVASIPMVEEKSWGEFKILNHSINTSHETFTKKLFISNNNTYKVDKNDGVSKTFFVINGYGERKTYNATYNLKTGDVFTNDFDIEITSNDNLEIVLIEIVPIKMENSNEN